VADDQLHKGIDQMNSSIDRMGEDKPDPKKGKLANWAIKWAAVCVTSVLLGPLALIAGICVGTRKTATPKTLFQGGFMAGMGLSITPFWCYYLYQWFGK